MNARIHFANIAPDYCFVQPQSGYNELEWSKVKMTTSLGILHHTPLLILMQDVIIRTQIEAMGARPPSLAVTAPIASF